MSGKDWIRFWLLSLVWGTSFLWIKIAVGEVGPLVLVGFRVLIGALGLLGVVWAGKELGNWQKLRPLLGVFALVGLINIGVPFALISWSEQYIPSGIASILNSTTPLFSMLLATVFLRSERLTPGRLLGLLVGFGGVVVMFLPELASGAAQGSNLAGQAAMLVATLSYAGGGILVRLKGGGLPTNVQAFLQLASASLIVWAAALGLEHPLVLPALPLTWLALLWLGLLGSCLAYILYFSLIHSIGPVRASTVTYVLPLIGVLLGAAFLGEQLTWPALAGGGLILSGIWVMNLKPRQKFHRGPKGC
jgi:drug/metabolite transporter (DMT)-like permease